MAKQSAKKTSGKAAPSHSALPKQATRIDSRTLPPLRDPALKTVWVDTMAVATRGDTPVSTITFYTVLTDARQEAVRVQTSTAHLKNIVDVLCANLGYYPLKPKPQKKAARRGLKKEANENKT